MLERDVIEDGFDGSMRKIWAFSVGVNAIQAEAVRLVLSREATAEQARKEARKKIVRLAKAAKKDSARAVRADAVKLIKSDTSAQMNLYRQAWEKGVVRTKPVIPQAVTVANAATTRAVERFVSDTIAQISLYAGREVADVIEMAIADKMSGKTTDAIAKAAAALISDRGITITMPSGRKAHDVYAYVRRNIVAAMIRNSAEQQKEISDNIDMPKEFKWYETSSHWGARPSHAVWQGRLFESWEALVEATDLGEITGLCGINCRHTFYPFIPGVSERRFYPKPKAENDRRYQARQQQKRLESQARKLAAEDEILKSLGLRPSNTAKTRDIRRRLRQMRELQGQLAAEYAEAA